MTNEQYYELFNTKVDVGEAIGITIQHSVIMEDTSQENFNKSFDNLSSDENLEVIKDTEKGYFSYIFLWKNGEQHKNYIFKTTSL